MTSPVAKALAGHTLAYGATTILSRMAAVVLLLVLPLLITPAAYGVLGLIMAANGVCITSIPLEVTQTVARFYPNAERREQIAYANAAWWFTVAMLGASAIIAVFFAMPLARQFFGDAGYAPHIKIASAMIGMNGLFYFVQNQLRWSFQIRSFAIVSLLYSAATLGFALALAAVLVDQLFGVLLGQAIGAAAACMAGLWFLRDTLAFQFSRGKLLEMLRVSAPLVPASLALMVNLYAGRLILSQLATLRDVGLFTYANQVAAISSFVIIGFQGSLIPLVMTHHEHPDTPKVLARSFEHFVVLANLVCLGIGLFASEAILRFGNPAYAASSSYVLPLAYSAVLAQAYIFGPGFLIAKRTGIQALLAVTVAGLCIAANYVLIPLLGIAGAVAASLATTAIYAVAWFTVSQMFYPIPVAWGRISVLTLGSLATGWLISATLSSTSWAIPAKFACLVMVLAVGAWLKLFEWSRLGAALRAMARRFLPGRNLGGARSS